jgi:acetylornithine deacetylase
MMADLKAQLSAAVEAYQEEYIALLADLVRLPSTLGNEKPAQERLLAHVVSMGLDSELWDLEPTALQADPRFVPVDRGYEDRPNLTATLQPGGQGGRSLVFNGHIDVVSAEPLDWWQHDPWGGEIEGGRLYGRGALDMKCGLVQALLAMRAVQAVNVPLRGAVIFESVIEEECTGNGMLACRLRSGRVDGAVITEPVGPGASVANTGTMWVRVTVEGKPAYVGRAGEYVNAVEKASFLIGRLGAIADEINNSFSHPAYAGEERPFTFSVGTIEGGDWPSNVPLVCRFVCRLSYPPGVDVRTIRGLVERHVQAAAADDPWLSKHPPQIDYPGFQADGWATDINTSLITTLSECHQRVIGEALEFGVVYGTADARYFNEAQGEQAVYYGPSGGNVHAPDEYVDLDTIITGAKVLAHLTVEWCS